MASVPTLLSLNLAFSMGFLMNFKPLFTFAQNYNNPPILVDVHTFFFLLPLNFFATIILLILHLSKPDSAYTKHLATATWALTFATLFFTVVLITTFVLTAAAIPDGIKTAFIAVVTMVVCISYVRSSLILCSCLTSGFLPVRFALCILTATLFLVDQSPTLFYCSHTNSLGNILIHLGFFGNFTLAIMLLFLRATAVLDGLPREITAGMVERLVKTTVAMSFTIIPIGIYMMVACIGRN